MEGRDYQTSPVQWIAEEPVPLPFSTCNNETTNPHSPFYASLNPSPKTSLSFPIFSLNISSCYVPKMGCFSFFGKMGCISFCGKRGCFSSKQIKDSFPKTPNLTSYEAACSSDPDLRIFDSDLHDRTTRAIRPFAASMKLGSFSFDSLGDLTETFLDTQPEVVESILKSKMEISKNPELFNFVEIYLESTHKTLDFFTSLKQCLDRARHSQIILQSALDQFEKEDKGSSNRYELAIQQLKNFEAAGDPFSDEFLLLFESISKQQISTLNKLIDEKSKLDGKLKSVKAWKKVSNIIFVATFAAVVIFSVIAVAITAPPLVVALATAATVPLGSMGGWLSSIWNKLESEVRGDGAIIGAARERTRVASFEWESIRGIVKEVILQMDSLLKTAGLGVKEEEAEGVKVAIDEMKKKSSEFLRSIDKLDKSVDKSSRDISRARKDLLKKFGETPKYLN